MAADANDGKATGAQRRAYWQTHVERWRRSGQSVPAYGRSHGLKPGNLYRWSAKLAKDSATRPAFIPVRLPAVSRTAYAVEVTLPHGRTVRIAAGADPAWESRAENR